MSSKVEREDRQEIVGEACFTLKTSLDAIWLPLNIPNYVWKIVDIIVYSLDAKYYKHVFVCVRKSHLEVTISNEYINHIDTCMSACLDAFEAVGCKKEGIVTACHAQCRKLVRQDAYNSLYETYTKVTNELEHIGYRYAAEFDDEDTPQRLKITVWLS
jgi:hypothetical protein